MAKVSISVPDDIVTEAKVAGLNISRLATAALSDELDRLAKIAQLDDYLAKQLAEVGPIPDSEAAEAANWADALTNPSTKSGAWLQRSA